MKMHLKALGVTALLGAAVALSAFTVPAGAAERPSAQCTSQDKAGASPTRLHGCAATTYGLTPLGLRRALEPSSGRGTDDSTPHLASAAAPAASGGQAGAPGGKPIEDPPLPSYDGDQPSLAASASTSSAGNGRGGRHGGNGNNH